MAVVRRCGEADGFGTDAQRAAWRRRWFCCAALKLARYGAPETRARPRCRGGRTTGVDFFAGVLGGQRVEVGLCRRRCSFAGERREPAGLRGWLAHWAFVTAFESWLKGARAGAID